MKKSYVQLSVPKLYSRWRDTCFDKRVNGLSPFDNIGVIGYKQNFLDVSQWHRAINQVLLHEI